MIVTIDTSKLIDEKRFEEIFSQKLDQQTYQRALTIYQNYGFLLSFCVTNVIAWAIKQDKTEQILTELENYWKDNPVDLKSQELKDRGLNPGFNDDPLSAPVIDPKIEQDFFILKLEQNILQLGG